MSRSYTRSVRRAKVRECGFGRKTVEFADFPEAKPEPRTITVEWALEVMAEAISFRVHNLIVEGYVQPGDAEDYLDIFTTAVADAVPKYDPNRVSACGRTSSARHFLDVVLTSKVCSTIESIKVARRAATLLPILWEDKTGDDGLPTPEEPWLADGGRSAASVEWRLDMEAMMRRMPEKPRKAFAMILAGYSHTEAIEACGVERNAYWRTIVPVIADVLRDGGYGPHR